MDENIIEANKQVVISFCKTAFIEKDPEKAMRLYVSHYYKQHNPFIQDGKQAFINYMKDYLNDKFYRQFEYKRVIAEGDYVVLHVRQTLGEDDKDFVIAPNGKAVIDIFRLEAGKIVEHWDVVQVVPAQSVNNNTMF